MSEPTDRDRQTAVEVLAAIYADSVWLTNSKVAAVDRVAQALADERAKALWDEREATLKYLARWNLGIQAFDDIGRGCHRVVDDQP